MGSPRDSSVRRAIRRMAKSSEEKSLVRFSVTLHETDDERLRYFANRLNMSRAAVANQLLAAAIDDLEDELGFSEVQQALKEVAAGGTLAVEEEEA